MLRYLSLKGRDDVNGLAPGMSNPYNGQTYEIKRMDSNVVERIAEWRAAEVRASFRASRVASGEMAPLTEFQRGLAKAAASMAAHERKPATKTPRARKKPGAAKKPRAVKKSTGRHGPAVKRGQPAMRSNARKTR